MRTIMLIMIVFLLSACSDTVPGWTVNLAVDICGGQDKIQEIIHSANGLMVVTCINGNSTQFNLQRSAERSN